MIKSIKYQSSDVLITQASQTELGMIPHFIKYLKTKQPKQNGIAASRNANEMSTPNKTLEYTRKVCELLF
jgi:hypothetical protein